MVKGKKIIHLGFADHKEIINSKLAANIWLHKHLVESSSFCLGIDIDEEDVEYVRSLGFKNIYCGDILKSKEILELISKDSYDILLAGEVIEHINDPLLFLKSLRELYNEHIKLLVITVPNVFAIRNFLPVLQGFEVINTDHRYWFSPFTLAKILSLSGFKLEEFYFVHSDNPVKVLPHKSIRFLYWTLLKYKPQFRSTIVMIARF
ncbi:MAG: methyltransferase domain-containing protein [Nitrososphaerota archaeon]